MRKAALMERGFLPQDRLKLRTWVDLAHFFRFYLEFLYLGAAKARTDRMVYACNPAISAWGMLPPGRLFEGTKPANKYN